MTTALTDKIDKKILQNLRDDYWKKNEIGEYVFKVQEIEDRYKRLYPDLNIRPGSIPTILAKNGLRHVRGICKICKKKVYVRSRQACIGPMKCNNCYMDGPCKQCHKPYEQGKSKKGYCFACYIPECERQIESYRRRVQIAENRRENVDQLNEERIKLLYLIKDHPDRFIKNKICDVEQLSFDAEQSVDQTSSHLGFLIEAGYVIGTILEWGDYYNCFSAEIKRLNVDLPKRKISYHFLKPSKSIIDSCSVRTLYKILCESFPYQCVFREQSPLTFLNKEQILKQLTSHEQKLFFDTLFNFVCTDENCKPVLIVEYSGKSNMIDGLHNTKKNLKKKICEMANIKLLQINSTEDHEEMGEFVYSLRNR